MIRSGCQVRLINELTPAGVHFKGKLHFFFCAFYETEALKALTSHDYLVTM